ncbi:hypothetical protein D9M68_949250 [compost metagenome]
MQAVVLISKEIAIGPFEIKQQSQRLSHAAIFENRTTRVEDKAQHVCRCTFLEVLFDDLSLCHSREIIELLPACRVSFKKHIEQSFLEGLKQGRFVAIIFDAQGFKIIETASNG